ncbi:protein SAR DEFICIENT 1-like [Curcuma longa]|uniref:protein SAR DEFICIENT 1-like n=1 Tax=Curcuma longa TaxID=136217 RepID=UPI003D9DD104
MAAKRLRQDADQDPESSSDGKRVRRLPSFSTVIREAMMAKSLQNIFLALEPLLRKVVQEEVEKGVIHGLRLYQRSNSMHIEAAPEASSLKLVFKTQLSLPIFTGSKIECVENQPLELVIVDSDTGEPLASPLPWTVRVEVVVLDGDFPDGDQSDWSSADFQRHIVKERTGKRPLLTGDVNITMRDASAVISDLCFTDNSSWIRSRRFRIGARVVAAAGSHNGQRIKEAMTVPFMVKDHRGELYRKHYPPALSDEVWRLERIGKDGAFHRKLSASNIHTVQEFLKLLAVEPHSLRDILGVGMSDRVWEATVAHAKTCPVEGKLYLYQGSQCSLLLNSICDVVGVVHGHATLTLQELSQSQRAYVRHLAKEAYQNWDRLEEANDLFNQRLLPQNMEMQQSGVEPLVWYPGDQGIAVDYQFEDYEIVDPALSGFG